MDKSPERVKAEVAFHRFAILTQLLESAPEIIDSLPLEEVSAELIEMGVDPQPPVDIAELRAALAIGDIDKDVDDLRREIRTLFEMAREEIFEDGMESEFSKSLSTIVETHNNKAIAALGEIIETHNVNEGVVAEALRWLGRLEHPSSYDARLRLLESNLRSQSARVRDACALGLASMDDAHAIPFLRQAILEEPYTELRDDMEQVLNQLESTR